MKEFGVLDSVEAEFTFPTGLLAMSPSWVPSRGLLTGTSIQVKNAEEKGEKGGGAKGRERR